jgi:hypothetical protein
LNLDRSLAVGEYIPASNAQTVSSGTHESIEGSLAQGEHHPPDATPKYGPAAHGARLGAGIQAAMSQELRGILVRRQAHEVCRGVPSAIRTCDHRVFSLEQHLILWARKQGTEGLIASLARPAGERDGRSQVLEIGVVQHGAP